jgi:hypothetical protein
MKTRAKRPVTNFESQEDEWSLVIRPNRGWFDLRLVELWQYRDLIMLFVRRDFVSVYKQTILGPLWFLIQPLLTTIIFTVVFGNIAGLPTDGLPQFLFYMSGTVVWTYFAECLTKTSSTFVSNARLFGKVYFPRLAVPVSILISNMITFTIQFLFFLVFIAFFALQGADVKPNLYFLLTPVQSDAENCTNHMPRIISIENLSKSYRLGQIGTGTLTNDLKVWWAKTRGKPNPLLNRPAGPR